MAPRAEPSFTLGIEEEYLVVDKATRDLVGELPPSILEECEALLEGQVSPEFLQAQIEVETRVCHTLAEARADLARLRRTVADVIGRHGMAPVAASTHPFGQWRTQKHTDKERYNLLAEDMQVLARRLLVCAMHVHVGIDDDELRIDLLNQLPYFLPHLLALSTSSPFWEGQDTGLNSYRLSVFHELPRSGLPERFDSFRHYQSVTETLLSAGIIEDNTKIWWDVRPSARFPTLELRITDICTRLDDGICIAALFRCLCRMLTRLRRANQGWRPYPRFLIDENRWRAQRYGIDQGLIDFGRGELVPYAQLIDELLELVGEDAEYFGCTAEVEHARTIVARGTSAHEQRRLYSEAVKSGASPEDALRAVVDGLIEGTVADL